MCLITTDRTPKIAQEDIVCYKILTKIREGKWVTPFQYYEVEFDKTLVEESVISNICEFHKTGWMLRKEWKIEKGWFHTFKNTNGAHSISCDKLDYCKVFKCVIPKGTEYYKGISFGEICYASKKLIITKEEV